MQRRQRQVPRIVPPAKSQSKTIKYCHNVAENPAISITEFVE